MKSVSVTILLCMFLVACGGGSSSGGGAAQTSINGTWVGTWESTDPALPGSGLARITIQQTGGEVSGTGSLTGSVCVVDVAFDGIISGNTLSLNLVGELAAVSINLQRIGENRMEGTWRVLASNVCGGNGTLTLNRE